MPLTLPQLAARLGASLDALRSLVRARPDLRALGSQLGSQRIFTEADAEVIASAWRDRRDRRRREVPVNG